jgi:group I intron endonuclease
MSFEVYLITNNANGKQYVGITLNGTEQRFHRHKWESRKGQAKRKRSAIHRAMIKYGEEKFSVQTIHVAESFEEMCRLEQHYIEQYKTMVPHGYNLTTGGRYFKMASAVIARMSERLKGKPMSDANREGLKRAWADASIKERRCQAIKEAMNRPDVREQTGARQRGKKKSAHHTAALRKARASAVRCTCTGQTFDAITDAVQWLRTERNWPTANHAKIIRACKSPEYSAYGLRWAYAA